VSDQKIKTASGKVRLDLLPLRALMGVARVLEYGSHKYAKGNWYTAADDEYPDRYVGGVLRHLSSAQRPDGTFNRHSLAALDLESGLPELDHMLTGLIILRGLLTKHGVLPADPGRGFTGPRYEIVPALLVGGRPCSYVHTQLQGCSLIERLGTDPDAVLSMQARADDQLAAYWPLAVVDNHAEGT
jgi:hypothetical protein